MPTSQGPKNPKPTDDGPSFHAHILGGIHPKEEAALIRESRQWYKKQYGGSDAALDKAFGIRSRDSGYATGGKVKVSKAEAKYRVAADKDKCGVCTMFRPPNSCITVTGYIRPQDTCKFFERVKHAK